MDQSCLSQFSFEQSFAKMAEDFSSEGFWHDISELNSFHMDFSPTRAYVEDLESIEQQLSLFFDDSFSPNDGGSHSEEEESRHNKEASPTSDSTCSTDEPQKQQPIECQSTTSEKPPKLHSVTKFGSPAPASNIDTLWLGQSDVEEANTSASNDPMIVQVPQSRNEAPCMSEMLHSSDSIITKNDMSGGHFCQGYSQMKHPIIIEISDDEEEYATVIKNQPSRRPDQKKAIIPSRKRKRSSQGRAKSKRRTSSETKNEDVIHHSKVVLDRDPEVSVRLVEGRGIPRNVSTSSEILIKWDRRTEQYRASTSNGLTASKNACDFDWRSVTIRISGDGHAVTLHREDELWTGLDTEAEISVPADQIETLLLFPGGENSITWDFA